MTCKTPIDICLMKGQENLLRFVATSGGVALNLAGYGARFQLRDADDAVLCSLDAEANGGIVLEEAGGIEVSVPQSVADGLPARAWYGLSLIEPSDRARILAHGQAIVADGIVKPPYDRVP